jgi:O-antigen/teichoic acid export membrane protein
MWYPRIFSAGHESLVTLRQLSLRLLTPVLVAAAFSTMVLLVLGPLLPLIIGEQFAKSSALLEVAAPVLILSALSYLGGDVLSGTDRLYLRVLFLVGAITAQALLVLILCPLLGPVGAVAAFYASSLILAVLCWSVVLRRAPSRQVA